MLLDELMLESIDWRNFYDLDLSHLPPPSLASPSIPRTPSSPSLGPFSSPVPDVARQGVKRMLVKAPRLDTLPEGDDASMSPLNGWSSDGSQTDLSDSEDDDDDNVHSGTLPAIGLGLGSLSDLDLVGDDDGDALSAADGRQRVHPPKTEQDTDLLELMLDSLLLELMLDSLLLEADFIPSRPPTALGRTSRSVKRRGLAHPAPLSIITPSAFPLTPATSPSLSTRSGHSSILLRSPAPSATSTMRSPESDASWSSDDLALRTPDADQAYPQPTWDLSLTPWMFTPPPSAGPSSPSLNFPSSPGLCGTLGHQPRSPLSHARPTSISTTAGTPNRPAAPRTNRWSASSPTPNRPSQKFFTNRPRALGSGLAHPFATPRKGSSNRPSCTPPPPPVSISPPTPPRSSASSRTSLASRSSPPPRPSSSSSSSASSSSSSSSRRTLPRRSALPAPFLAEIGQTIGHAV